MSFFSDNPAVSSCYATGKSDTSRDVSNDDYSTWFLVKIPGSRSEVNIVRAWYSLSAEERSVIAQRAPKVCNDDTGIIFDENNKNGVGNYDIALADARGNCLKALVEGWLSSGNLFGKEEQFLKVLRMVGFKLPVRMFDPRSSMPFVYQVFLSIQNPLYTHDIPPNLVTAIQKAVKSRRNTSNSWADQWTKKYHSPKQWVEDFLKDIEEKTGNVWTMIPDWVTDVLKSLGYDGIIDNNGLRGREGSGVYIPFHDGQVKSAISNKKFDSSNMNIHK